MFDSTYHLSFSFLTAFALPLLYKIWVSRPLSVVQSMFKWIWKQNSGLSWPQQTPQHTEVYTFCIMHLWHTTNRNMAIIHSLTEWYWGEKYLSAVRPTPDNRWADNVQKQYIDDCLLGKVENPVCSKLHKAFFKEQQEKKTVKS